jgi:hypothetical protein
MSQHIVIEWIRFVKSTIILQTKYRRALIIVLFVSCAGAVFASRAYREAESKPRAPVAPVAAPPVHPVAQGGAQEADVELITVHPWGFDPREIVRPEGRFYILIQNRSLLTKLDVQLNRISGVTGLLNEVEMPLGKTRRYDLYDLPPGDYVLTERAHPTWPCKVKITAKQ